MISQSLHNSTENTTPTDQSVCELERLRRAVRGKRLTSAILERSGIPGDDAIAALKSVQEGGLMEVQTLDITPSAEVDIPGSAPGLEKPLHIEQSHWDEWVERSCISPEITSATLVSPDNHKTIRKFIGWKQYPKNKYPLGWIAYSGEFDGSRSEIFGQFKPDKPICMENGEVKYLTPAIVSGSNVKQDCIIAPIRNAEQWNTILGDVSISVAITEGFKKDCALETQGQVVCGLVGVNRWHEKGNKFKLYPKLNAFATPGRTFDIYFDSDWQQNPLVRGQMLDLTEVLESRGCKIIIKTWEYSENTKGIDDLIAAYPDNWREHVSDISSDELRKVSQNLEAEAIREQSEKNNQLIEEFAKFKQKYRCTRDIRFYEVEEDGEKKQKVYIPMRDLFLFDKEFGNRRIRYQEMLGDYELDGEAVDWNTIRLDMEIQGFELTHQRCEEFVRKVGNCDKYSPVRDYLNSLPYIDPSYLDTLASKYFGVPADDELSKIYFRKWLIGAVGRAFEPGCAMDYMLVLLSPNQGIGKTLFFRKLASEDFFTDTFGGQEGITNKDELVKLRQSWILELGELDYLLNRSACEQFKRFLSTTKDNYRVAYGRGNKTYPRSCAFAGTSNRLELLTDETGNRRYFIIPVPDKWEIPVDLLDGDRDLIWAAAVSAYKQGESHFIDKKYREQLEVRNKAHLERDIWEEIVIRFLENSENAHRSWWTSNDLLELAIKLEPSKMGQRDQNRLTKIMLGLGWHKGNKKYAGRVVKAWLKPEVAGSDSENKPATRPATSESADRQAFQEEVAGSDSTNNQNTITQEKNKNMESDNSGFSSFSFSPENLVRDENRPATRYPDSNPCTARADVGSGSNSEPATYPLPATYNSSHLPAPHSPQVGDVGTFVVSTRSGEKSFSGTLQESSNRGMHCVQDGNGYFSSDFRLNEVMRVSSYDPDLGF